MQTKGSKHQSEKENDANLQLIETHNQPFTLNPKQSIILHIILIPV